ncbi:MAG: polyphosphate kinase 1 [Megasphaera micronuciformis]|nr:polyphosphate kinase 1 [Megasphaera micronuciformis]
MIHAKENRYLNRECTWINFNERVVNEAAISSIPLLERVNFLSISASNNDEFFMIRVAGIKHLLAEQITRKDIAGLTPKEQFEAIQLMEHSQCRRQYKIYRDVKKRLSAEGIHIISFDEANEEEKLYLEKYVKEEIYPVVTPLAVDTAHFVPFLASLSLNLAVFLQREGGGLMKAAVLPVPLKTVPRLIEIPQKRGGHTFVFCEDLLAAYGHLFFPGYIITEIRPFRLTRDADLEISKDAADLLAEVKKSLKKRKKGAPVRLETDCRVSPAMRRFLKTVAEVEEADIYEIDGPVDLTGLFEITALPEYDRLRFPAASPQPVWELLPYRKEELWSVVKKHNIMMHHPYETFAAVDDFIYLAAKDPDVLAIKQTLYRVGTQSAIIDALAEAAENGKEVTVLMEVKARFDEENNIHKARKLEEAGCHVIYGVAGLKTHSKITLVVRRESDGIRRYVHLATGNYNGKTARIYTDVGILTADRAMGEDASAFFNLLSGYFESPAWKKLAVAPYDLREQLYSSIDREISVAKAGKKAVIIAKMNSLLDRHVIDRLYEASQAGVTVRLVVRGICVLRPGVTGLSENISVHSIVGRFLEHSRLFYFYNDGAEDVFISSADWMPRNLNERIELLVPVEYGPHKERIKEILRLNYEDNVNGHIMDQNGEYTYLADNRTGPAVNAQETFQQLAEQAALGLENG